MALGLFGGRVLSELVPILTGHSLVKALLLTAVTLIIAIYLTQFNKNRRHWPLFFLLFYLFYPEPNPETAVFTLLFVFIIYLLNRNALWPMGVWAAGTAVVFAALYIATLSPDILPADNGEFQLVATQLGVAHPPGFSLYTLLAHGMTRLPLPATPAYKVNLFAALTSAATLLLLFLTVYKLTNRRGAAVTAVIALGTATTFWAQATTANIRSLTGLLAALMIYALVRFSGYEAGRLESRKLEARDYWLAVFALALGLGVTHHASLVFMGVVFLIFVLAVDFSLVRQPRRWIRPFLFGLLGLLPLLYFPLRAGADVRGASGDLATPGGFLNHILALGFRGDLFYFITPADLWQRFQVMGNVLTFQFSPWLLAGMGVGFWVMLRHDRRLALLLGGSFALHTFITATYRAPQTVEYMLPAYVPLAIGLGYGIGQVAGGKWQVAGRKVMPVYEAVYGAIMLTAAIYQGWQYYPSYAYLHRDSSTRDYTQLLLEQAPDKAVILADWHWATPLWYLQEVEGLRDDVDVQFVFPEGESYADTWARRIETELANGRSVIATHFDEGAYANLPLPEPLGDAFLFRQQPRTAVPPYFAPLDVTLSNGLRVVGYDLSPAAVEIGQEAVLTIAWEREAGSSASYALFAHLVGDDGRLYAQDDLPARSQSAGITLTQFRLTPRLGAAPGDFAIMLGAADDPDGRTAIASLPVTAMSQPPVTQHKVYRTVPSGRPLLRLVGYDWDNTLPERPRLYLHWQTEQGYQTEIRDDFPPMPAYFGPWNRLIHNSQFTIHNSQFYIPLGQGLVWTGAPFSLQPSAFSLQPSAFSLQQPVIFRSRHPITHDLVISVRLIGYEADGYHWAWSDLDDSIPAMGAIPTLKWIAGSTVRSPHRLIVDSAVQPGQPVGAVLRVYDAFTNRPLPILDERIVNELQLSWVPLGQGRWEE